ncbi:MAG: sigma-54-dependent Fis family transcriptional regulator [Desulfuromusa sp.]|jgi:transcriptional regulator of acetoin/glycerol metabolism|nr:sigma-54-dependent Fis family transcriptional regulator [Desulfuromusa sp.]
MSINEIRQHTQKIIDYVSGNKALSRKGVPSPITSSWKRSLDDHGIDPSKTEPVRILTANELREYTDPIEDFLRIAKVGVQQLHRQVVDLGYSTLLCDAHGVTVDWRGNERFTKQWKEAGLYLGALWSEHQEGTCGVGTALIEQIPLTVHRGEHFRVNNSQLTCSCAPIIGPNGQTMGLIDVSSLYSPESKDSQHLALRLVMQSARMIEMAYFLHQYEDQWVLCLSQDRELAGVSSECLIALDGNGKILAADRIASRVLEPEIAEKKLMGSGIDKVFELNFDKLLEITYRSNLIFPLVTQKNRQCLFASLRSPQAISLRQSPVFTRKANHRPGASPVSVFTLDRLAGSDFTLQKQVRKIKRVVNKSIPILLTGETGTGKEVFAKAIHTASSRADKPFIAVNCAAIPEALIESELFGYKEGAFTGANKKGMRGKILQAHGGTLFLDEIGDMPMALQPRLLRALAEHEITPLGGETAIPIDLHLICATHRDIKELIDLGMFREDLYYRLNGVSFSLPPLRERADLETLIYDLLVLEGGTEAKDIMIIPEVMELLTAFSWPGNIRQLRNALRYALAVSDNGTISLEDLPAEICNETITKNLSSTVDQQHQLRETEITSLESNQVKRAAMACEWNTQEQQERQKILTALQKNKWQIAKAIPEIGLSRATIYRKIEKYRIIPPNKR